MSGVLVNLLLLYFSGTLQLNSEEWSRIGGIFVIGLVYISVFIALGILISTLANNASTSLVILLLIWVIWVVLVPPMLGTIMSGLNQPAIRRGPSPVYFSRSGLKEHYIARGLEEEAPTRTRPPTPATLLWAEFLNEEAREGARLHKALLKRTNKPDSDCERVQSYLTDSNCAIRNRISCRDGVSKTSEIF